MHVASPYKWKAAITQQETEATAAQAPRRIESAARVSFARSTEKHLILF
jgi:hypothetical protein